MGIVKTAKQYKKKYDDYMTASEKKRYDNLMSKAKDARADLRREKAMSKAQADINKLKAYRNRRQSEDEDVFGLGGFGSPSRRKKRKDPFDMSEFFEF